jgi:hypothetical protein
MTGTPLSLDYKLHVKKRKLMAIVVAEVIFNHGLEFGIIFPKSDDEAHEKLIASKKSLLLSDD